MDQIPEAEDEMVDIDDMPPDVEDTEDGGAIVRLEEEAEVQANYEHFANIVEDVDQTALDKIVSDLRDKIDRDRKAREKRDKLYEEGLRRTGLGDDAPGGAQFSGATKVVHPLLVQSCVDFSARAMKEIFPPNGVAKAKIVGKNDRKRSEKAQRKVDFMNWQITEQMVEFRGELEQLFTQLPLGGVQYTKITWCRRRQRPVAEFIAVDDIYLPFAATNFYTAERKTHVQYVTDTEYQNRVESGMYKDVDLPPPSEPDFSKSSKANDKIEGRNLDTYNEDGLRTIYEVFTNLEIDGEVAPYIISIDDTSGQALSLYRNWDEGDESKEELVWIVEWPFIPWRGAYPIGLTHLIGGLSGAATGALRALLDAAHIQNIPGVLKLKGGPNGQTLSIQPTEVVEMEGGINVDDIRKIAMPMPFNPPSPVLYQLLGFLVDAGRSVVQTSFEKLSDSNPNMPVGTTVALIEQGLVVFSSIHARLHSAMGRALNVVHRLNSAYLTDDIVKQQAGDLEVQAEDFDGPIDIIPVSDPQVFSETQRFAQVQALMQRSAMMPQMYDQRRIEEMFLAAMKVPDDVLKPKPGQDDMDPVSENVAGTMGRPLYVLTKQDHIAHLQIHLAFMKSPLFGSNPVMARTFMPSIVNHLRDHLLNYYMTQAHKGIKTAQDGMVISDQGHEEAEFVITVQQAIEQQLAEMPQLLQQADEFAKKFMPPPMPPDNTMAVAQLRRQTDQESIAIQNRALDQKQQTEAANLQLKARDQDRKAQLDAAKLQLDAQNQAQQVQDNARRAQTDMERENLRQQHADARNTESTQARVMMNVSDNETAKQLAAAEMATGEKVAVSTGTGINPQP